MWKSTCQLKCLPWRARAQFIVKNHRLNMELELQSLFGLHVHSCTHWLRPWLRPRIPPPLSPRILWPPLYLTNGGYQLWLSDVLAVFMCICFDWIMHNGWGQFKRISKKITVDQIWLLNRPFASPFASGCLKFDWTYQNGQDWQCKDDSDDVI